MEAGPALGQCSSLYITVDWTIVRGTGAGRSHPTRPDNAVAAGSLSSPIVSLSGHSFCARAASENTPMSAKDFWNVIKHLCWHR